MQIGLNKKEREVLEIVEGMLHCVYTKMSEDLCSINLVLHTGIPFSEKPFYL